MGMMTAINTAASGLTAQRLRLDTVANNIANVNTTSTPEGGVFQRSRVIMRPRVPQPYWKGPFVPEFLDNGLGRGVRVTEISKDTTPGRLVYDPTHPDRIRSGENKDYVMMPNVSVVQEMVDMMAASRSYEANSAVINGAKSMFSRALEISR